MRQSPEFGRYDKRGGYFVGWYPLATIDAIVDDKTVRHPTIKTNDTLKLLDIEPLRA